MVMFVFVNNISVSFNYF